MKKALIATGLAFCLSLCLAGQALSQETLSAEFLYSDSSPDGQLDITYFVEAKLDGSASVYQSFPTDFDVAFSAPVSVGLLPDSAIIELDLDFVESPVILENDLDLGFAGLLHYRITITDGSIYLAAEQVSIKPDLSFGETQVAFEGALSGIVEIQSSSSIFDLTPIGGATTNALAGDFDLSADLTTATFLLMVQTGYRFGPVYTGVINGNLLEIWVGFQNSNNVPKAIGRETSPTTGADSDGDEVFDVIDNCPQEPNLDQADTDNNGVGDACNDGEDQDGDEYADDIDNCPNDFNADQADADFDLIGDVCDPFPNNDDNEQAQCEADLEQALIDLEECQNACTPTHKKEKGPRCTDGLDNDCDGMMDSEDPDCQ